MELRADVAQRHVQLGREHEHRQRRLEADVPVDEPHADRDRNERDPERRGQLEHRARQERDAERAHRRAPVLVGDSRDLGCLRLAAVERAQRRQPAHHVEEVSGQHPQCLPALAGAAFGRAPDQPHEERHERQRQQHHARRDQIEPRDRDQHGNRHDDREHRLRQVAREQRLQRVDAGDRCGRHLCALGAVERGGLHAQTPIDQVEPELRQHAGGRAPAGDLEAPPERRPRDNHRREQHDRRRDIAERRAVERLGRDVREQYRLREDEQRHRDADRRVQTDQQPGGPRTLQQPGIDAAHVSVHRREIRRHVGDRVRRWQRCELVVEDGGAREVVLQRAPAVVDEHRHEAEEGDRDRDAEPDEAHRRPPETRRRAGSVEESQPHQPHARRLAGA